MLVQYQKNNLTKLKDATKNNNELVVVGSTGSGRKHVIEQWGNGLPKSIVIQLKFSDMKIPYASLITSLKDVEPFKKKAMKINPSFSISGIIGSVNASLEETLFFKNEDEIIKRLLKLIKHHYIVFIIDKSHAISDGSIEIIKKFKSECKQKQKLYIIYVSNAMERNANNIYFDDLSSCTSSSREILKELNWDSSITLGDKTVDFIFSNINNNINLLIRIIEDLNNGNLDCHLEDYDQNHVITQLLETAHNGYEYSKQLNELLSICAISEHYFQSVDFAYLLEEHESVINLLLEYAQNKFLINGQGNSFYILFGIVKKIYASLDEYSKRKLYIRIVNMFENIHPSMYYEKYLFAKLAEMNGCNKYLMQYLFSEIRLNHSVDLDKFQSELNEKEFNIVTTYNKAVGYSSSKRYDKCIDELNSLKELNSELLYEINIIKSQSLIKKMDETARTKAISLLEFDNTINDENLKFRLNIRRIAAQIHIGEHTKALTTCEQTIGHLLNKLEETRATEYEYYLNVIYRKYSYVGEYDTSINEVEKSVEFFRKNRNEYHKGYYIALTNLLSLYIINMQLSKAETTKEELEELLITKNNLSFPRKEIMENNFLLFDFFAQVKNLEGICNAFKKLYDETKGAADNILIASNYSVFLMLNNDFQMAEEVLRNEMPDDSTDLEGIYDTRVKINLAVCKFLMNNEERDNCIKMLDSVEYNKQAPYYRVRTEELNGIKTLMSSIEQCNDANKWCEAFKSNVSSPVSSYTTYQQGFVYTTLFNWDDD